MSTAASAAGKQRGRPWPKGTSGNPRGRAKGSRNRATLALDAIAARHVEAVQQTVIAAAIEGDMQAAAIILGRAWPPRRGARVVFDLPPIKTAEDTVQAASALLGAVARGELSPDEAQGVAALIDGVRKAIETHDHELRLARLEAQQQESH